MTLYAVCSDMSMTPREVLALPAAERRFLYTGAVSYREAMREGL